MLLLRGDSVELTRSLRDKKLIKVLLALEEKMPGFTARWLINTKPTFYKPSEVDMIRYAVGKTGSLVPDDKKPYWPFAPAGLAALYLAAAVVASSRASKAYQTTKTT
jgi:hypothetical protein